MARETLRSSSAARDSVTASMGMSRSPKGSWRIAARSSSRSLARCRSDIDGQRQAGTDGQRGDEADHRRLPGHRAAAAGDQLGHRRDGAGLGTHLPGPDRGLEDAGRQVDAGVQQGVEELRPQAGRLDLADLAAVDRHAGHETEELLEQDDVAFEALDLLDGRRSGGPRPTPARAGRSR